MNNFSTILVIAIWLMHRIVELICELVTPLVILAGAAAVVAVVEVAVIILTVMQ